MATYLEAAKLDCRSSGHGVFSIVTQVTDSKLMRQMKFRESAATYNREQPGAKHWLVSDRPSARRFGISGIGDDLSNQNDPKENSRNAS